MAEEKNNTNIPTFVMRTQEMSVHKKHPYKKYAIIGVSVALTIAIVLAAILVGMYLYSEAQKEIIKFAYTRDDNTKEEVTSDPNSNIVQYQVNSNNYKLWVVNDFNRDIQMLKFNFSGDIVCYVTPLNRTMYEDPSHILTPTDPKAPNAKFYVNYRPGKDLIKDKSFLSKPARDMCTAYSTFWLYPQCEDPKETLRRKKRQTSSRFEVADLAGDCTCCCGCCCCRCC